MIEETKTNNSEDETTNKIIEDSEVLKWIEYNLSKLEEKRSFIGKICINISNLWKKKEKSNERIPERWVDIGKEVYARKTLLLSAQKDLNANGIDEPFVLAATDIFVEKAQRLLTKRGRMLITTGIILSIVLVVFLLGVTWYYYLNHNDSEITALNLNGYSLTLIVLKKLTIASIILALGYFLIAITRALFHEGLTLFSRRHALRFGRLYVYIKKGKVDYKELEDAFKWNQEFSTAFKDIQPDKMTKTIIHRVIDIIPEVVNKSIEAYLKSSAENKTTPK
ncbi:MAG: hypothetical protein NTZ33_15470 [Bacteroidetes bacterium]|nr:hypothetical protein [Bacteroidota bacterium]